MNKADKVMEIIRESNNKDYVKILISYLGLGDLLSNKVFYIVYNKLEEEHLDEILEDFGEK